MKPETIKKLKSAIFRSLFFTIVVTGLRILFSLKDNKVEFSNSILLSGCILFIIMFFIYYFFHNNNPTWGDVLKNLKENKNEKQIFEFINKSFSGLRFTHFFQFCIRYFH